MSETYYDLLGVSSEAPTEEIKAAYRERLKETHPDVNDAEDADVQTRELIRARDVLTDTDERERYDRLGHDEYVAATDDPFDPPDPDEAAAPGDDGPDFGAATTADTGWTGDAGWGSDDAGRAGSDGDDGGEGASDDPVDVEGVSWADTQRSRVGSDGGRGTSASAASDGGVGGYADRDWQAWEGDRAYTIGGDGGPFHGRRIPRGSTLVVLLACWTVYPALLWGLLVPGFPVWTKVLLGICGLLVIAYLQSMPTVAAVVFGSWTAGLPLLFPLAFGVDPTSLFALAMVGGTAFPLGLSLLTRAAIRH